MMDDEMGGVTKRGRIRCRIIVVFVLLVLCWLGTWPASKLIWYGVGEKHEIPYRLAARFEGVEVLLWAKPTTHEWSRNRWFPLLLRSSHRGPHSLGIRFVDQKGSAKGVTIHSAVLEREDGSTITLRMVGGTSRSEAEWWPFHRNASTYIVHLFHPEPIDIEAPAVLKLDFSLDVPERTIRRRLSMRVEIEVRESSGLAFPT